MAFSFPLPDPNSSMLIGAPDDQVAEGIAPAPTPELTAAVQQSIADQTAALSTVVQQLIGAILQQLQQQQAALQVVFATIAQAVQQQLTVQQVGLTTTLQAIQDFVTLKLASDRETVGVTATVAAMQPRTAPGVPPLPVRPAPVQVPSPGAPAGPAPPRPGPFSTPRPPAPTTPQAPTSPPVGALVAPTAPGGGSVRPGTAGRDVIPPTAPHVLVAGGGETAPGLPGIQGSPAVPGAPLPGAPPAPEDGWYVVYDGTTGAPVLVDHLTAGTPPPAGQVLSPPHPDWSSATATASNGPITVSISEPVTVNVQVGAADRETIPPGQPRTQLAPAGDESGAEAAPGPVVPGCALQLPAILSGGIPLPGSLAWCQIQDQVAAALGQLGTAVLTVLLSPVQLVAGGLAAALEQAGAAETIAPVVAPVASILAPKLVSGIVRAGVDLIHDVAAIVACWRQIVAITPRCNPATLLGLVAVRGLVRALQRVRAGTDAGVWLTADLSLDLPQLDRIVGYLLESLCPSIIPDPGAARAAWKAGMIPREQYACLSLSAGRDPDLWEPFYVAAGHAVSPHDAILYSRLHGAGPDDADTALAQRGWGRQPDRQAILDLYDAPPAPEQWFAWHGLQADDEGHVERFALRDGWDQWWAGPAGVSCRAQGYTSERARVEFAARRQLPGAGEAREYLWRLRPGPDVEGPVFTDSDYAALLVSANAPPPAVEWAMATRFRPLTLADVAGLAVQDRADQVAFLAAAQAAGYSDDDAQAVADMTWAHAQRERASRNGGYTLRAVVGAVQAAILSPAAAMPLLQGQRYTEQDVRDAVDVAWLERRVTAVFRGQMMAKRKLQGAVEQGYTVGTLDADAATAALVASGADATSAAAILTGIDTALLASQTGSLVKALETAYKRGELTANQAGITLQQAGITTPRAIQYVRVWTAERNAERPMIQVGQIRSLVVEGLLSLPAARQRLVNLGWANPDLALQLSAMGAALAKAQAGASSKSAKAHQAAAKAAEQVKQQALRRLERTQPVAALGQWFKDGQLGEQEVRTRLASYNYDADSIDLYLRGWKWQMANRKPTSTQPAAPGKLPPQRQQPVSALKSWYLSGLKDAAYVRERMSSYGYSADTISDYLRAWDAKRKPPKAGAPAAPPTGARTGGGAG